MLYWETVCAMCFCISRWNNKCIILCNAVGRPCENCIRTIRDWLDEGQISSAVYIAYSPMRCTAYKATNNHGVIIKLEIPHILQLFNKHRRSVFSYSQQGFFPSYCSAYIAGSKAAEGRYQTMSGSVWWEECSPWGQSRQHLYFHHQYRAPLERRMSNNACKKPKSPLSLVVPLEYLCHSAAEYVNGCVLFLTNQTNPLPTLGPVRCSALL